MRINMTLIRPAFGTSFRNGNNAVLLSDSYKGTRNGPQYAQEARGIYAALEADSKNWPTGENPFIVIGCLRAGMRASLYPDQGQKPAKALIYCKTEDLPAVRTFLRDQMGDTPVVHTPAEFQKGIMDWMKNP